VAGTGFALVPMQKQSGYHSPKRRIRMKKASFAWLLVVAGLVIVPISVQSQEVKSAVVIKNDSCTFFDIDGETLITVPGGTEDLDSIKVVTPSQNCNKNVSCHTTIAAPEQAYVFDYDSRNHGTGFLCEVWFKYTDANGIKQEYSATTQNWHETITPKGNISLTCHFKCEAGVPTLQ
jgi:hypothetical protein